MNTARLGHAIVPIGDAVKARKLTYTYICLVCLVCLVCRTRVIPHRQGRNGARAHFEHKHGRCTS